MCANALLPPTCSKPLLLLTYLNCSSNKTHFINALGKPLLYDWPVKKLVTPELKMLVVVNSEGTIVEP
jgi:hypothetical protein